ncbi:hypothetical protein GJ744_009833 [Endocarpon pusillum]|uniref:Uncharacterized protein n=1 Tax=Endocarpon pusillum TaxID=364733 RepID=A0A8H7AUY5_9EURO|nr:hypothetical protein GJ744_009833 [Endocarpon pusillum]
MPLLFAWDQSCSEGDVSDRSPFFHEPELSYQSFSSRDPSGPGFLAPSPLPASVLDFDFIAISNAAVKGIGRLSLYASQHRARELLWA